MAGPMRPKRAAGDIVGGDDADAGHLAVLNASPNAILAVDSSGMITYANPRVAATFGYEASEILGQPIEILIPERVHERHRTHRGTYLGQHRARPMGIGLDLSGRRSDGTEFPVEISLAPVETPDGLRVYATVVDITARKAAEDAQAESEHRFRAVVEASPNPIVGMDAGGRISYANPQVLPTFGWTPEELVGQQIERLIPERFTERHIGHRTEFMDAPHARPMGIGLDLWARRRDGTEFPVEISLSPVKTKDAPLVFARVVDITQRKALEDQLLQSQKMESIGRLAGGIAHDFNNMLSAVSGYAELLLEDLDRHDVDQAETRANVMAIQAAAERATVLTGQLLAFARRQVVSPKVIELNESVTRLEPMLRRLIGERIQFELVPGEVVRRIRCDPSQLDQILVNLVVNARDAIKGTGRIILSTGEAVFDEPYAMEHFDVAPGAYAMVAVSDTGAGMDHETRAHVFEPFFTTKELGQGTGLGLATIYGIVKQANGHIWLYSEPGAGTTFKIYFPLVEQPEQLEPQVSSSRGDVGSGRALVVEDEDMVRGLTVRMLRRSGYEVVEARDGNEALEALAAGAAFDVLVTDVVMPGIDGTALAERVRAERPRVAIILLSGYTAETLELEALLARGAAFVAKPFSGHQLLDAVREARANTDDPTRTRSAADTRDA